MTSTASTTATVDGRRADSARRRQRVIKALNTATATGTEISISSIARAAHVGRTFLHLHRHCDLLAQIYTAQSRAGGPVEGAVSSASLKADLVNANGRAARQALRIRMLEKRLSELFGDRAWRERGLGAVDDIGQFKRRIGLLEKQVTALSDDLADREEQLKQPAKPAAISSDDSAEGHLGGSRTGAWIGRERRHARHSVPWLG